MKLLKDILTVRTTFTKGTPVTINWDTYRAPTHAMLTPEGGHAVAIPAISLYKYIDKAVQPPPMASIIAGDTTTVYGAQANADGYGPDGEPSWEMVFEIGD